MGVDHALPQGNSMPKRSRYDELHDRYNTILTTKGGTRYEILAAFVFKALEEQDTVIHDMSLVGESDVAHQIDVLVERNGVERRVLIECKDFYISGKKIGLDIVRNFRSVLEDTNADEGMVVTCNGFTTDAQKYAKSKGIKLVVLRAVEQADMAGRISTVVVNLHILAPKTPTATVSLSDASQRLLAEECAKAGLNGGVSIADPVYFVRGSERFQFNDFLTSKMRAAMQAAKPHETHTVSVPPEGWSIQVGNGVLIPFDAIQVVFEMDEQIRQIKISSDRIAELILSGFGEDDIMIFGDQLERRKIDPDTGAIL
jgi:hypothetical protein